LRSALAHVDKKVRDHLYFHPRMGELYDCLHWNFVRSDLCSLQYDRRRTIMKLDGRRIRLDGAWAKCAYDELRLEMRGYFKERRPKRGDVVIDAGAFGGVFALMASAMVGPQGKVIAFEPNPENYAALLYNLRKNKVTNVIPLQSGLWDSAGRLELTDDAESSTVVVGDRLVQQLDRPFDHAKHVRAEVCRADEALAQLGIKQVDFVKMDIEGAELRAMEGFGELLGPSIGHLAIASYHVVDGSRTCFALEQILRSKGYRVHTDYPKHLTTYASRA